MDSGTLRWMKTYFREINQPRVSMMSTSSFKITFNKPAFRAFFEGESVAGLRIRIEKDAVFFRPAETVSGSDVVPVTERTRGGIEAHIEGSMAETLLKLLNPKQGNPFFLLRRSKAWIEAFEYTGKSYEPPKFEPHARVWVKDARELINRVPETMDLSRFMNEVREAKSLVDSHDPERRGGRPSREVLEARALLRSFAELAREVLPFQTIVEAHEMIGRFLAMEDIAKPEARAQRSEDATGFVETESEDKTSDEIAATAVDDATAAEHKARLRNRRIEARRMAHTGS